MRPAVRHGLILASFAALAVIGTWPLAMRLFTHLPGDPAGDSGVYVWNLWVFFHELVEHQRFPFFTDTIFGLTGATNLSQHNYTTFPNLLALPFMGWLGSVATYNAVLLLLVTLNGYAMFLLARRVTGDTAAAWLAGVTFAWSPIFFARSQAHLSLVAAAPVALFALCLVNIIEKRRMIDGVCAGACLAVAALCDAYFGIYCVLIAAVVLGMQVVQRRPQALATTPRAAWPLHVLTFCLAGLVIGLSLRGGRRLDLGGIRVTTATLYTPMLLLTIALLVECVLWVRRHVAWQAALLPWRRLVLSGAAMAVVTLALLSPVLFALGQHVADGRFVMPRTYWRTSPRGVDLLAFLVPNPSHPWFGAIARSWLDPSGASASVEATASLSLVALAVVMFAAWRRRGAVDRVFVAVTAAFALLALGPFVYIAGTNTYIPGPWALARYLPVVELARSPSRFAIVAALGLSVLLAAAIAAWRRSGHRSARIGVPLVAAALLFELAPMPRPLVAVDIPSFYNAIARDTVATDRVLELPVGVRDGTSSIGNTTALTQFYQTIHHKPVIGGYLSRVSEQRKTASRRLPVLDALFTLSERRPLSAEQRAAAWEGRDYFLARSLVRYVIVDTRLASPELVTFAAELLALERVSADGTRVLYRPRPEAIAHAVATDVPDLK